MVPVDSATWPFGAALAMAVCLGLLESLRTRWRRDAPAWARCSLVEALTDRDDAPLRQARGEVPVLVLVTLFLAAFALGGLIAEAVAVTITGAFVPATVAGVPALLSGLAGWAAGAAFVDPPPDRVPRASAASGLIGRSAVVLRGVAARGHAAEARVFDASGQARYLMVEPQAAGDVFPEGARVQLVAQRSGTFLCARATREAFFDDDDVIAG